MRCRQNQGRSAFGMSTTRECSSPGILTGCPSQGLWVVHEVEELRVNGKKKKSSFPTVSYSRRFDCRVLAPNLGNFHLSVVL